MDGFAERLNRLEDRAALQDLVARYFLASDGDDLPQLRASFAAEAIFAVSGQVGGKCREGIVAFLVEQRASMGLTVHTPNYGLFTLHDSDHAEGLVGAHLELVLQGQAIYGAVRYQDSYVREDGAWRILHRDMRVIQLARWDQLAEAFASETPVRWPGAAPSASDFPRRQGAPA